MIAVEKTVDQDRLDEYQNRMSEWMGEQGIFFQLRYAGIVGNYSIANQVSNLFVKLLIFMVAVIGIGYLLLNRHFSSDPYLSSLSDGISESVGASEIEVSGFSRARGQGVFRAIEMTGSDDSFFMEAEIKNLSGPFDFLSGITSEWSPKQLIMGSASFQLKAGGEDGEMGQAFESLIQTFDESGLNSVAINELDLDWGYSKLTYGAVTGTEFRAVLVDGIWEVNVKGGSFTQNWLQNFEIVNGELEVSPSGIKVESLELARNEGTLDLSGSIEGTLDLPKFNLKGNFSKLPIEELVQLSGLNVRDFISGLISGKLEIQGSTNRRITTKGSVALKDGDFVTIREKWPILKTMSVLDMNRDMNRSYRRIDFEEGSFGFETSGGSLALNNISLRSGDLLQLQGSVVSHLPNQEEAAKALNIVLTDGFGGGVRNDLTDTSGAQSLEDERMTLRRVTGGGKVNNFELSLGNEDGTGDSTMSPVQLEEQRLRYEMNIHRFKGQMMLGVASASFSEYASLRKLYPSDESGWRWVPLGYEATFSEFTKIESSRLLDDSRIRISKSDGE